MAGLASAGGDDRAPALSAARCPAAPAIRSARAPCISADTVYRIHGTNAPTTIGQHVSSGCIRLTNEDVIDLFDRASIGAKVVVLPDRGYGRRSPLTSRRAPAPRALVPRPHVSVGQPTIAAPRPVAQASDGSRTVMFGSRIY